MLMKMETPNRRSKKRLAKNWKDLIPQDNFLDHGKSTISCKCPKCGNCHKARVQWTGRGIPRIYCANCKPLIAAIDNFGQNDGGGSVSRRSRKSTDHAHE